MAKETIINIRLTEEETKEFEELKARLGLKQNTEVIRFVLQYYQTMEKINIEKIRDEYGKHT